MKFKKVLAILLTFAMLFTAVSTANVFAADEDGTTDETTTAVSTEGEEPGEGEGEEEEEVFSKGDVLTTADGLFSYYKYELTDELTGTVSCILEIKEYLGDQTEVVVPEKLDEPADSPYSVRIIGDESFMDKTELFKVTLPETVERIGLRAFNNCSALASINLPDSILVIDGWAFHECVSLQAIHMPANIKTIGAAAFFGCTSFTGNTTILSEVPNEDGTYSNVVALTFPNTLTSIGDNAFGRCESLVNVIIPSSITAIYTGTFTNCFALELVDLPYSVSVLGNAFNGAFTEHNRLSTYQPTLIIRNPHCRITLSAEMDAHMLIKGVKYSQVQAMAEAGEYEFEAIAPPAEHNYSYSGVVTPPTCYEDGYTTYTCDCGLYDDFCVTDIVPSPGHQYASWYIGETGEGDDSTVVDPTDVEGYEEENDGSIDIPEFDEIFGGETEEGTPEGEEPEAEVEVVSDKPITEEEFQAIREAGVYKPFCTAGEGISRKCTECGKVEYGNKNPEGHKVYMVTTATCTTPGVVREKCAACNITFSQKTAVPLGHVWAEETETVSEYVKCSTDGVIRHTCMVCKGTLDEIKPAHLDANKDSVCDDCGVNLAAVDCSCACHKTGFFWDLINSIRLILWKLFGVERLCDCGVAHY